MQIKFQSESYSSGYAPFVFRTSEFKPASLQHLVGFTYRLEDGNKSGQGDVKLLIITCVSGLMFRESIIFEFSLSRIYTVGQIDVDVTTSQCRQVIVETLTNMKNSFELNIKDSFSFVPSVPSQTTAKIEDFVQELTQYLSDYLKK